MILVPLRLVIVPDGGLPAVGIPRVLPALLPSKKNRLMLPLVITAAKHKAVLYPDTHPCQVESGVDKCLPEIQAFRVGMEHISGAAAFRCSAMHWNAVRRKV